MSKNPTIYLDYNATAPIKPASRDHMRTVLDMVGNASSVHGYGRDIRREVERAREAVAALVHCEAINVTFTSGATEANNMVLFGTKAERILISAIEHPSLIDAAKDLSNVEIIPVNKAGIVDIEWLKAALESDPRETLISVMMVNNETGVVQPIKEIVALAQAHGDAKVHSDAVQAAGRIKINIEKLSVDYLSLSAHKFGGPMGAGALIYNHDKSHMLKPFTQGGGQERGRRSGTENAAAIAGFGEAATLAISNRTDFQNMAIWRDEIEAKILNAVPKAIIFGENAVRVANTIQVSLPGVKASTQLMALDLAGIAVSSGSACSSGSIKPSHVLQAMGASEEEAMGALRCSFGWNTTHAELDSFVEAWIEVAKSHGF